MSSMCRSIGIPLALAASSLVCVQSPRAEVATLWTPDEISTDQYESSPTFTPDGREMFYMQSDPAFRRYRLLWSRCIGGAWTTPRPPAFASPGPAFDADPFLTADGTRLYFISTRQNLTADDDDFDIWYVDRGRDGAFTQAHRLPEPVNSERSELMPRATADGRIYFGSDRPGGFGGGDIYVAAPGTGGAWSVSNLGPPASTAAYEYEAEISRDQRTLVVVADRGDRSHLYLFRRHDEQWVEERRIPARSDVFQVGPLLSPAADRLLFAEAHGGLSGELLLIDLAGEVDARWPPSCRKQ